MRREDGMTLLEVMVAMILLAIVALYLAGVPILSSTAIRESNKSTKANMAVRDKIEEFRREISRSNQMTQFDGYDALLLANPNNQWRPVGSPEIVNIGGERFGRRWKVDTLPMGRRPQGATQPGIVARCTLYVFPVDQAGNSIAKRGDTVYTVFGFSRRLRVEGWEN